MAVAPRRRQAILQRVASSGYVASRELATSLGVNSSTIRRDLESLEREGQLSRTHGGARLVSDGSEVPYELKAGQFLPEKAAIARAAAARVRDGDVVILDSGSTTFQIARELAGRRITVITNDLRIATFVAASTEARLLVTGGELLNSVFTLVGDHAQAFLDQARADWTFLGADAVAMDAGITNTNTLEVPIKRAMIAASRNTAVVADISKFRRRAPAQVAPIASVTDVITTSGLTTAELEPFAGKLCVVD
jgi:DeoR/GlpR family transcriptional regulator of sugar metabolism